MTLLRSALFNLWFYGVTFVMAVGGVVLHGAARERVAAYAASWARLMLGGLRRICGIRIEVTGLEHLPAEGPALVASMHQSALDTLVWPALVPRFTYVLKQELMRIPLFGALLRGAGMIAVDRGAGAAAMRGMLKEAEAVLADGRVIVIFPEGTRVAPGRRVKLQPGIAALALRSGLPVIPVLTDSGRCWGPRAFRKRPGVVRVAIQPPLPAGLPRDALLARLESLFAGDINSLGRVVENSVGDPADGSLRL